MLENIDWEKVEGLLPAIVQSSKDHSILMLGYMNEEALKLTQKLGEVHFYSRTKKRTWKKGETSGNVLKLDEIHLDCDGDAILILATPTGPICHKGSENCFKYKNFSPHFLDTLDRVIEDRIQNGHRESYTHSLVQQGTTKVTQKVIEEALEVAMARTQKEVIEESADLLFHMMVNLRSQGLKLKEVIACLQKRHRG